MKVIAIGCEYVGTSTLMEQFQEWLSGALGQTTIIHDHSKLPTVSGHPPIETPGTILTEEEKRQVMEMTPKVKELFTRYTLYCHTPSSPDSSTILGGMLIGHHIDDLVYAPLYYGYGGPGEPGDRRVEAALIEQNFLKYVPETVLVLLKTSGEVVRQRMKESPHADGLVRDEDIEHLLQRFDEEFARSTIRNKITLDTTNSTPAETFEDFLGKMDPFWTEGDRLRMLTHTL